MCCFQSTILFAAESLWQGGLLCSRMNIRQHARRRCSGCNRANRDRRNYYCSFQTCFHRWHSGMQLLWHRNISNIRYYDATLINLLMKRGEKIIYFQGWLSWKSVTHGGFCILASPVPERDKKDAEASKHDSSPYWRTAETGFGGRKSG